MSHSPRRGASARTPVGHLSVHLEELHAAPAPCPFEQGRKRAPAAFIASLVVHGVAVAALVVAFRSGRTAGRTTGVTADRMPAGIVWIVQPGPAGDEHGGGGGGDRSRMPPRKVELPGKDSLTVAAAPRSRVSFQPRAVVPPDTAPPIAQLDLSALKMAGSAEMMPGSMDGVPHKGSRGPGGGDGAGDGQGSGDGPGRGPGAGPGSGGNRGGGPVQFGTAGLREPRLLREVRPDYTSDAMRARIEGTAIIECTVLPDGTVGDVEVVKSLDRTFGLDQEAMKAAQKWLFQPATLKGQPVAMRISIYLTFALR